MNKTASVGMHFLSWNKRNILVPKIVWPCWFLFAHSMFKQRGNIRKTIQWKRFGHWCSVSTGKSHLSGPPFQWETRQAGTVGPPGWDFPVSIENQWWILFVWDARKNLLYSYQMTIKFKYLPYVLAVKVYIFQNRRKNWAFCTILACASVQSQEHLSVI